MMACQRRFEEHNCIPDLGIRLDFNYNQHPFASAATDAGGFSSA
jgi:hypothetical protein